MARKRLYLVDGNNHVFRAFHAIRGLTASDGTPTGAVFGFTSMLLKLLRETRPDYLAVVFDHPGPSFRSKLYPAYKAHRPPLPEDLRPQLSLVREVTTALNVALFEVEDVEADDVIASLTDRFRDEVDVVIVSTDKDLMQLVGHGCALLDTMRDKRYRPPEVEAKLGVVPADVVDLLALMGDSSDNVPGVPGIGPKTAASLLSQYGSLDGVYAALDAGDKRIKGKRRQNLEENREAAYLSQQLVTVRRDLPLDASLEALALAEPDHDKVGELFTRLDFKKWQAEFRAADGPAEPQDLGASNRVMVNDEASLAELLRALGEAETFAFWTVTTADHPIAGRLVGIGLAVDRQRTWYVPLGHATLDAAGQQLPRERVIEALAPLLSDPARSKAVERFKNERQIWRRHGVELAGVDFDAMLASYVIDPSRYREHTLDAIATDRLDHAPIKLKEVLGSGKSKQRPDQTALTSMRDYACERAQLVLACRPTLEAGVDRGGLRRLLEELEMPLSAVLADMELAGVRVDAPLLRQLAEEWGGRAAAVERECHELAGEAFAVGSPKQLGRILFQKLGLPAKKRTKTGYSTDSSVLEELAELHPLPAKVTEWRSLSILRSTFADALPQLIHQETGRVHTTYNQAVTATGRLSSADPNLQNIPIRTAEGRRIREAFIADEGMRLLAVDYSQIELRILAHLCGSEGMQRAFRDGADIHERTARELFDVTDEVSRSQRAMAKTINFGILYGMGPGRLAREQGLTHGQAKEIIRKYFDRYPQILAWKEKVLADARREGLVRTLAGRVRRVPELKSKSGAHRAFGERVAVNTPVQGSAADIIKEAMIVIQRRLRDEHPGARMVMQVHDELVFEAPLDSIDPVRDMVVSVMEGVVDLDVPLVANAAVGSNWLEAH